MSRYQDSLVRLGSNTERVVAQVAQRLETIGPEAFASLVAALLARSNARGHYIAEQALAGHLARTYGLAPGVVAAGLPIAPEAIDTARLAAAASTAVAVPEQATQRISRLAYNEPISTAHAAMSRAMDERPEVTGWTRETEANACDACLSLAGATLPTSVPMWHHVGCVCAQQPVTR